MNEIHGQYDFNKDVNTGEDGEAIVRKFLELWQMKFDSDNKDFRYDLKMFYPINGKFYTYEVKTDVYKKPGNIVIEFECRGKKSGIAVTEADYFLTYFYNQGEIWNIKTDKLKILIDYLKPEQTKNSGDVGSGTRLYKFKKEDVRKYFKVNYVNKDYLINLIKNDKK